MPQDSYLFAVGRTWVLERRMLNSAKLARLREADNIEALKLLTESGYGAGTVAVGDDVEPLIKSEMTQVRKTVWDMTPDAEITSLFLLPNDAHNLKALLKARLLGVDASDLIIEGGAFEPKKLMWCVENKDYRDLPDAFSEAMNSIEKQISVDPDPRVLSATVDGAVFDYAAAVIKKKKNAFAHNYFCVQADFLNIRSILRARSLGWGADKLGAMLVTGGEIEKKKFLEAIDLPIDQLTKKLAIGKFSRAIAGSIEEYTLTGNTDGVEKRMDKELMKLVREGKDDTFGLGPVVGYLLGREAEAKALRLIFAAKRTGRDVDLPELYM